jgi:UDP-N-acetylmuramate dehydrogenase
MANSPQLQHKVDLQSLHTFALPANADHFFNLSATAQLSELADLVRQLALPVIILSAGSNTVFSGQIKSLLVHVALRGVQIINENSDEVILGHLY